MERTFYTFVSDFIDEGRDVALDRMQQAGATGVTVAAVYHAARDVFPHNPRHRVRFLEPGVCYFPVDDRRYQGLKLQPRVSEIIGTTDDPLASLRVATSERGMQLNAWVVYLHNDHLGFVHPDCAAQNVFGDPYPTQLCPANPHAQAYAAALTGDLARYGFNAILAESLHYYPLTHGYHHERCLFALGALPRLLLGLCFCEHCVRGAHDHGVDVAAVTRFCRETIEAAFAGRVPASDDITATGIAAHCHGELAAFFDFRTRAVADLTTRVAEPLAGEPAGRFIYMDQSGARMGEAEGPPAAETAWRIGVAPGLVGRAADDYEVLAYCKEPERVDREVAAYRAALPDPMTLRCSLRPTVPDCGNADNLSAKLRVLDAAGVEAVDFYHYGLIPLANVSWVKKALADV